MSSASGNTRQELASINAKIDTTAMNEAFLNLKILIKNLSVDELALVLPEVKKVISRFFKKKKRELTSLLESKLCGSSGEVVEAADDGVSVHQETPLEGYEFRLQKLQESHIFQWATYYRDTIGFIFRDVTGFLEYAGSWESCLDSLSSLFSQHSFNICTRGVKHSQHNGFAEDIVIHKSIGGLQQFLYLIMNIYVEQQDKISTSKQSQLARQITSCMLAGVLNGYALALGWARLCGSYRHWVPALGFMSGSDAAALLQEKEMTPPVLVGLFDTVVPLLIAVDTLSNQLHDFDFIYPKISLIRSSEPLKLEVTWARVLSRDVSSFLVSCVFSENIEDIVDAESLPSTGIMIVRSSAIVKEWIEQHNELRFVDASGVGGRSDNATDLSEIIVARIKKQLVSNAEQDKTQFVSHNYAKDFPLEDPEYRRFFHVERHSVKLLLEKFEHSTGVHLWCSVRRSGKTTAAASLADMTARSVVVFQTMDNAPELPHHKVFEQAIMEALLEGKGIPGDFFESLVEKCVLSNITDGLQKRKIVFVLDEYETLFGILSALASENQTIKFMIALPLLSQMKNFASRNLLIFMGQRPDAFYILPSQNQLSPLVVQHNFPLFEHHSGGADSEFSQLLKKVLTPSLPFTTTFIEAVYAETSGHPYLTVNLMVDFCDWLIGNKNIAPASALDANLFLSFSKERLSLAALSRSTFYQFFQSQLNSYVSGSEKSDELWLYAIAKVLSQIGRRHPRALSCTIASYNEIASKAVAGSSLTPAMLLSTGLMSNFLKKDEGHVKPAIRLMARLAACSKLELI